jgi:cytochrome c oxidase assembly protein subunit 15
MVPAMHFGDAFALNRELGMAADGHVLNMADLTAIHWLHRLWAVVAFVLLGLLSHLTARQTGLRALGIAIAVALFAQVLLGISNVVLQLPLPIAVLHNAGAALLLCLLITLNYRLAQSR